MCRIKMLLNTYIFVYLMVYFPNCLCLSFTEEDVKRIDNLVESFMECKNIPGLGLSIVKDGDAFVKGYGFSNIKTKEKFDRNTISCIGSTGKAFTVVLLGILLGEITKENKRYNWNTNIRDILGYDFKFSDDFRTSDATLIDILTHRTGLMTTEFLLLSGFPNENTTRGELVSRLRFLPSRFKFRDRFLYDNLMYVLAGHVAEKIGGNSYEKLIEEKILKPLGMNSATFIDDIMNRPESFNFARPYHLHDMEFQESDPRAYILRIFAPAGGLCTSQSDLTKWLKFLLNGGRTDEGVQLIDHTLFSEVPLPRMTLSEDLQEYFTLKKPLPVVALTVGYGMAWIVSNYRGNDMLQHSGNIHSYTSDAKLFPQKGIGVFISINGPQPTSLVSLSYAISDVLLNETSWLNNDTVCSFPRPWIKYSSHDGGSHQSDQEYSYPLHEMFGLYTGQYGHLMFGNIIVDVKNNKLHLSIGILMKGYLLQTKSPEIFQMEFEEPFNETVTQSPKVIFTDKKKNVFNQVNISSILWGGEMYDFYRNIRYEDYTFGRMKNFNQSSGNNLHLKLILLIFIADMLFI